MSKVVVEDIQKAIENMALYPFVHVSALELHALSHYPGNRQNDRMTEMTDRNINRLLYAFTAHAHRGIINPIVHIFYTENLIQG